MPPPHLSLIQGELASYGFDLQPAVIEGLAIYLNLLLKWNSKHNLTGLSDTLEIVRTLFAESIFSSFLLDPKDSPILDIGSGAGFPGMVLSLHQLGRRVYLVEPRSKKASFLSATRRELSLTDLTIIRKRLENCDRGDFPEPPRVVSMRGVAEQWQLVERVAPFAESSYKIMLFVSCNQEGEVKTHLPHFTFQSYPVPWRQEHLVLLGQLSN